MKYNAVVLAGGRLERSLARAGETGPKAFLDVAGKPMVEYALATLKGMEEINSITLVAGEDAVPEGPRALVDAIKEPGKSMIESLQSGMSGSDFHPETPVFVMPCDVPLITGNAVQDFLRQCESANADGYYAFISRNTSEAKFPTVHHTYVRLREGVFCGGGLFLLKPRILENAARFFGRLTEARKNIIKMAGIIGFSFLIRAPFGLLSVADLEKRVSHLIGCAVKGIESRFAEAGFNVDGPAELKMARKIIGEGRGAVS